MSDKPILFSAPMVRALLEGRKTQRRQVLVIPKGFNCVDMAICDPEIFKHLEINDAARWGDNFADDHAPLSITELPKNKVGDRLWVKETWRPHSLGETSWDVEISYFADGAVRLIKDGEFGNGDWNWPKAAAKGNVTPLFMPRWASRITLTVTDVRVERLHEIGEDDAIAEGIESIRICGAGNCWKHYTAVRPAVGFINPIQSYETLWNSINGVGAWEQNPWVVAYTFTVQHGNIDQASA